MKNITSPAKLKLEIAKNLIFKTKGYLTNFAILGLRTKKTKNPATAGGNSAFKAVRKF
jgi:hypothetical protein